MDFGEATLLPEAAIECGRLCRGCLADYLAHQVTESLNNHLFCSTLIAAAASPLPHQAALEAEAYPRSADAAFDQRRAEQRASTGGGMGGTTIAIFTLSLLLAATCTLLGLVTR